MSVVKMPMIAPHVTNTFTHGRSAYCGPNAAATGAVLSISRNGTMPQRTNEKPTYSKAHTSNDAVIAIGKSRCGFTHSSAALAMVPKPMYAKQHVVDVDRTGPKPKGTNGTRLSVCILKHPTTMISTTIAVLAATRKPLARLSPRSTPTQSVPVISAARTTATARGSGRRTPRCAIAVCKYVAQESIPSAAPTWKSTSRLIPKTSAKISPKAAYAYKYTFPAMGILAASSA
mmetsp:Transcript_102472/g.313317  ORF Transcript_102472/g.313317 Transcript_102472/m.313317 type:complete len:231 (+) Transcript_102472:620-1312(+)